MKKIMMTLVLMPMMALASLTDGLVAYWPFDGNANDASGNGNHGVVHGATLTTDRFGNANGAYYFGDGKYISVLANDQLNAITDFTLSAWVRVDSWYGGYGYAAIACKGTSVGQYNVTLDRSGNLVDIAYDSGRIHNLELTSPVPSGKWVHVVATRNSGTAKFYINGKEVGSSSSSILPFDEGPFEIGRDVPGETEYFYGAMDDVRLYNRALSAAEVKALYDGTAVVPEPVPTDGLVELYPLDGNANDASGHGWFLEAQNGPTLTIDRFGNANSAYCFDGDKAQNFHFCSDDSERIVRASVGTFSVSLWFQTDVSYSDYGAGWAWNLGNYALFPPHGGFHGENTAGLGVKVGSDGIEVVEHAGGHMPTVLTYNADIGTGWNHVTVTVMDNGAPVLYLNGVRVAQGNVTEKVKVYFVTEIGGWQWGYYTGKIDDVRHYNRALSAAEVKALYDGTAVTPPEPVVYTVTFDLNGADGAAPVGRNVAEVAAVGELPDVTREGYSFDGWYTAASGGTKITASTTVTGDVTYYAHWTVNQYTMTFDANGGVGGTVKTQDYGTALTAPTVTREGYTFTGWSPAVPATVPANNATYTAQWRVNQYTATFDANGGVGGTVKTQDYGTALTAPTVTREGYTFTGWSPSVPSSVPAADATYTAQWRINSYTVTFDAQGGAGGGTVARNHGAALGELPVPTRDGFSFDGWFTAASGGAAVSAGTVITGAVTFYAHWTEQSLYPTPVWFDEEGEEIDWTAYYDGDEEPFAAEAAATFDGYVMDGEEVCGLIQVKAGKASKKTGTSTVSASLTLLGEAKKRSYKGTLSKRGVAVLTCSGKGDLSLCLGTNAMWGEVDGLTVSGARNVFAKSGDPKASALSKWQGSYTLALETVDASGSGSTFAWGYSGLTVSVGAKGKVKVQGTMVDGAKVNVTSQLLVGDERCCIPFVVPMYSKKGGFGFNLWLHDDGTIEVCELSAWDATASKTPFTAWFGESVPVARAATSLPASMSFMLTGEPDIDGILYDFLPWEVQFTGGGRWTVPAGGSIKYDKGEDEYYDAKESSNPAGLKLTYVSKLGTFKGSFKMYAVDSSGRLKKLTANVSGAMVGNVGYGMATVKGVGSWPVMIE